MGHSKVSKSDAAAATAPVPAYFISRIVDGGHYHVPTRWLLDFRGRCGRTLAQGNHRTAPASGPGPATAATLG